MNFFKCTFLRFSWHFFFNFLFINVSYRLFFFFLKVSCFAISFLRISRIFFSILCFNKFKVVFFFLFCSVSFFFSSTNYSFTTTFANCLTFFIYNSIDMDFFKSTFFSFWLWSRFFYYFFINVSYRLFFFGFEVSLSR